MTVGATRRTILTIGLLFVVFGVFVLANGPQVFGKVAETVGLASQYETETHIIPATLVSVGPLNYTFLSANLRRSLQVKGSVQVADGREIAFYLLNEGNFSLWRSGHPTEVILVSPAAISYNFTFTPASDGIYYFIFDNHDTSNRIVIFSLSAIGTDTALNPIVQYSGYEALAMGIMLSLVGLKTGKKRPVAKAVELAGWKCKFCSAENSGSETFCMKCGRSQN